MHHQKLTNASVFTTNKPPGNAAAFHIVAGIQGRIVVVADFPGGLTGVKRAVERLDLSRPELEVAGSVVTVAREGDLWRSVGKHIQNLPVYGNRSECKTQVGKVCLLVTSQNWWLLNTVSPPV